MGKVKVKFSWTDKDLGYEAIRKELEKVGQGSGSYVKVGLMGDVKDRHQGDPVGAVELGVIHEFGAPEAGIPERSWLRSGVDRFRGEWEQLRRRLVGMLFDGKTTGERALGILGARAANDIKRHIRDGIEPPNSPETIARKLGGGSAQRVSTKYLKSLTNGRSPKALIDTGRMLGSIAWQVVMGDGSKKSGGGDGGAEE